MDGGGNKASEGRGGGVKSQMVLKFIIISYVSSLIWTFTLGLADTYDTAALFYAQQRNTVEDCKTPQFVRRYPQMCAEILLNPPASFWSTWVSDGVERTSVCGPMPCESLFTLRGMVTLSAVVLISYILRKI